MIITCALKAFEIMPPAKGLYFFFKPVFQRFERHFHIIVRLKVQPELRLHVEIPPESQRGVGGDSPAAMNGFVDATGRYSDVFCKPVLADAQWLQKFCEKNSTGMNGRKSRFGIMTCF